MKNKNAIICGIMTASMLSTAVVANVFAAGENVSISANKVVAEQGESFTVDVSFANVPSGGLSSFDFAIEYDKSIVSIDSVEAGAITKTGADSADGSAGMLELFNFDIDSANGIVTTVWTTAAESTYWIKDDGVAVTVSGKVLDSAADGAVSDISIVPIARETYPDSGVYNNKITLGSDTVRHDYTVTKGSVTVKSSSTSTGEVIWGDATVDGSVNVGDVIAVLQYVAAPANYPLTDRGAINADVNLNGNGINSQDAVAIKSWYIGIINTLPES